MDAAVLSPAVHPRMSQVALGCSEHAVQSHRLLARELNLVRCQIPWGPLPVHQSLHDRQGKEQPGDCANPKLTEGDLSYQNSP